MKIIKMVKAKPKFKKRKENGVKTKRKLLKT